MVATIPVWLGNAFISGYVQESNTILRAIFTCLRSSNTAQQVWKLVDVCVSGKSKMAAMNRKCIRNDVYLSCMRYSNEFPSAIRSGNTTGLVRVPERETFCDIDNVPRTPRHRGRCSGGRVNLNAITMNGPQ